MPLHPREEIVVFALIHLQLLGESVSDTGNYIIML